MFEILQHRFQPIASSFMSSPSIKPLLSGDLTVEEYRSVLRQIFHHTRENPQLQVLATVYFRGRQRDMVRSFFAHAASEIGHDQMALNDYVTLGGDATNIPYENPLPATTALLSYGFYQVYNLNPLGYLGYLYFLEFIGTSSGGVIIEALIKLGVPENATTFLREHAEVDIAHNNLMKKYIAQLVSDNAKLDAITYAMKTTAYLYQNMIAAAIEDVSSPMATGWNWEELNADEKMPADSSLKVV